MVVESIISIVQLIQLRSLEFENYEKVEPRLVFPALYAITVADYPDWLDAVSPVYDDLSV